MSSESALEHLSSRLLTHSSYVVVVGIPTSYFLLRRVARAKSSQSHQTSPHPFRASQHGMYTYSLLCRPVLKWSLLPPPISRMRARLTPVCHRAELRSKTLHLLARDQGPPAQVPPRDVQVQRSTSCHLYARLPRGPTPMRPSSPPFLRARRRILPDRDCTLRVRSAPARADFFLSLRRTSRHDRQGHQGDQAG